MPNWIVTYDDVIEADTEEEARKRLVRVLESDVACNDTSAFKFKIHGIRDESQSHHYYKQGYDFGIYLFCKQEEWTHE